MSVTYLTDPSFLPLGPGVTLIHSNEDGLVALSKPAGVKSHPNVSEDKPNSLLDAGYNYDGERFFWTNEKGVEHEAFLINRLDSPTSGVILLGLNPDISTAIKAVFTSHHVVKTYYAVVRGTPKVPSGTWTDRLKKDVYRGGKRVSGGATVPARTDYQTSKKITGGFPICLLRLKPITGRTHQLRVQCKTHSHPIVGDRTYGSFSFNREVKTETKVKRMLLHCRSTSMKYAFKGKSRAFEAHSEIPEAFNDVLNFRPGLLLGKISSADNRDSSKASIPAAPADTKKPTNLEGRRFRAPE